MSSAYARSTRVTGWRRVASALWSAPSDPQIFGALDVDATAIRAFIADARGAGHRVTPTHLVGRAVARAFATVPELNAQIRRGRLIPRDSIDIFFITAVESGHDLSGVKVADVERLALKVGDDPEFARTKRLMDALPRMSCGWRCGPARS
jgi:pyruvate/2-oxoglutarate dehydrogenase complex dihydrolipoamide acyltransferase (E2) component